MTAVRCRIKDYIQPFERSLALQELLAVAATKPIPVDDAETSTEFIVSTSSSLATLAGRLAYWEVISSKAKAVILFGIS